MALSVSSYEIIVPDCQQIVLVNAQPGERVDYHMIIDDSPTHKPTKLDDDASAYTTCLMELKMSNGGSEASLITLDGYHVLDQETCLKIKRSIVSCEQVRAKELEYAVKNGIKDEEVCVICQEGFETGQICTETECNHLFHDECIENWLELKNECPICRTKITPFIWYDSSDETN